MRSWRGMVRLLAGSIAAGFLGLSACRLEAVESSQAFVDGLRKREFYDTALDYLEAMRTSPLADKALRRGDRLRDGHYPGGERPGAAAGGPGETAERSPERFSEVHRRPSLALAGHRRAGPFGQSAGGARAAQDGVGRAVQAYAGGEEPVGHRGPRALPGRPEVVRRHRHRAEREAQGIQDHRLQRLEAAHRAGSASDRHHAGAAGPGVDRLRGGPDVRAGQQGEQGEPPGRGGEVSTNSSRSIPAGWAATTPASTKPAATRSWATMPRRRRSWAR